MSFEFDYSVGRSRSCPVCNGLRNDCRRNLRTNNIHCRDRAASSSDYIYLKEDSLGFGIYQSIEDRERWKKEQNNRSALFEGDREQLRRKIEAEKKEKLAAVAAARKDKFAKSLSVEERDKEIRKVLAFLELSEKDRESLCKRFSILTDDLESIEKLILEGEYKSLERLTSSEKIKDVKFYNLKTPVNGRLPGITKNGRSIKVRGAGILCPIRNERGLYIGWQIRLDDSDNGGKYRWAGGANLQNGELPLSIYSPITSDGIFSGLNVIGLTEGTAFKPYIAAQRLGISVIGCSGGAVCQHSRTIKKLFRFLWC